MMGHRAVDRPVVRAVADEPLPRRVDGKLHLDRVRVRVDGDGVYRVARSGAQASNALAATAAADGLALLPDGEGVGAGQDVRVLLLRAAAPDH
jgi:molybdopterin biosynthesis enzyme